MDLNLRTLLDPISKLEESVPPVTVYVKLSVASGSVVLKVPKLAPAIFSAALPPLRAISVGLSLTSVKERVKVEEALAEPESVEVTITL